MTAKDPSRSKNLAPYVADMTRDHTSIESSPFTNGDEAIPLNNFNHEHLLTNRPPSQMSGGTTLPMYDSIGRKPPPYHRICGLSNGDSEHLDARFDGAPRGDGRGIEVWHRGDDVSLAQEQGIALTGGTSRNFECGVPRLSPIPRDFVHRLAGLSDGLEDPVVRPAPVYFGNRLGEGRVGFRAERGDEGRRPFLFFDGDTSDRRCGCCEFVLCALSIIALLVFLGWAIWGAVVSRNGVEAV